MRDKKDPSEYYFYPVEEDNELYDGWEDSDPPLTPKVDGTIFYICPKNHWDNTKFLYDGCVASETNIPQGFSECQEGCCEISLPVDKAKEILSNFGFVEKYIGPPWGKI